MKVEKEFQFKEGPNVFRLGDEGFRILSVIAQEEVRLPYPINVMFDDQLEWGDDEVTLEIDSNVYENALDSLNHFIKDYPELK